MSGSCNKQPTFVLKVFSTVTFSEYLTAERSIQTMATFFRGKQAGMQNDLSANIIPGSFLPDDRARYGINSQIRYATHQPVQLMSSLQDIIIKSS
ncbi:hypothetical protein F4781DRAFT_388154 [Annulohypoxylon bovei var. microspora]|nr:hypothetical protein F4781DRAFT_388154 [Annulohypoxylon bovei var. microspora]